MTVVRSSFLCLLLLVICLSGQSKALEFWVAPDGNDASAGTEAEPFQTLEKARDAVRALSKTMESDACVWLKDGIYRLREPLRLDIEDSGFNGHSVIYKAVPGGRPVLSGGVPVQRWVQDTVGRWKAKCPVRDTRQLYLNGVRLQRARGPVPEGTERYGDLQFIDQDAGHLFPGEGMAAWKNQKDVELHYFNSWSHMICKVREITPDGAGRSKVSMAQPWFCLASRKEGVKATTPETIENALELLDEPGEWYLDKTTKTLFLIPPEGQDMGTALVIVPAVERLLEIQGTPSSPVHDVRFEGITFCEATWLQPNRIGLCDVQANFTFSSRNVFERDGSLVNMHNEYLKSPACILLSGAHRVVFERCVFTRLGGAGVDMEKGSQENVISGCEFYDLSGSGIQIGDVLAEDHHPSDPRRIVKGNQVTNTFIHDVGAEFQDSVGVFVGYAQKTWVAHNEIRDLPYSGISVGWGWGEEDAGGGNYVIPYRYSQATPCSENLIELNHLHDCMLLRNDGGGIYTLGNQPGTILRGNHIHDNAQGGGPGGIYLDEGSGFIEVTGNLVYNVATPMNYNNRAQDRISTCNEHDNAFGVLPGDASFPQSIVDAAGR